MPSHVMLRNGKGPAFYEVMPSHVECNLHWIVLPDWVDLLMNDSWMSCQVVERPTHSKVLHSVMPSHVMRLCTLDNTWTQNSLSSRVELLIWCGLPSHVTDAAMPWQQCSGWWLVDTHHVASLGSNYSLFRNSASPCNWTDGLSSWEVTAWHVFKMENAKMNNGNGMFCHAHTRKKLKSPSLCAFWLRNWPELNLNILSAYDLLLRLSIDAYSVYPGRLQLPKYYEWVTSWCYLD